MPPDVGSVCPLKSSEPLLECILGLRKQRMVMQQPPGTSSPGLCDLGTYVGALFSRVLLDSP